jgi:hypothetical protein
MAALVVLFDDGLHIAAFSNKDLKALVDCLSSYRSLLATWAYVKSFNASIRKLLKNKNRGALLPARAPG